MESSVFWVTKLITAVWQPGQVLPTHNKRKRISILFQETARLDFKIYVLRCSIIIIHCDHPQVSKSKSLFEKLKVVGFLLDSVFYQFLLAHFIIYCHILKNVNILYQGFLKGTMLLIINAFGKTWKSSYFSMDF